MTADIITLDARRPPQNPPDGGNGARERIKDYLERIHPARVMARSIVTQEEIDASLTDEDNFIAWLWYEGFKVVPLGEDE